MHENGLRLHHSKKNEQQKGTRAIALIAIVLVAIITVRTSLTRPTGRHRLRRQIPNHFAVASPPMKHTEKVIITAIFGEKVILSFESMIPDDHISFILRSI